MSDQPNTPVNPPDSLLPKELKISFKDESAKGSAYKPSLWLRFLEGSERIAKILGAAAIPVVLFFAGQKFNEKAQEKTLSKEYMTIALEILKNKNSTDPSLYAWAVDLLNANAPVAMDSTLQAKLKTKEVRLMSSKEVYETYQNSDPSAAIEEYSTILDKTPNYVVALYHRATAYIRIGELDSAMADYNKLLRIDPIHANAYHNRGLLWMQKGEQDSACLDFNRAIELGNITAINSSSIHCPQTPVVVTEKKKTNKQSEYSKQLQSVNKLIKATPKNDKLYAQRANIHHKFKNWQAAHDDWGRVLELKPKVGIAYYNRGFLKLNLKRKGACTDFKKALELGYNAQKAIDKYCSSK